MEGRVAINLLDMVLFEKKAKEPCTFELCKLFNFLLGIKLKEQ